MLHFLLMTTNVDLDKLVSDKNIDLFKTLHNRNVLHDIRGKFEVACEKGELEFAKWLYELDTNNFWKSNYKVCLYNACVGGHLETAKWIRNIIKDDTIIQTTDCRYIFSKVCDDSDIQT